MAAFRGQPSWSGGLLRIAEEYVPRTLQDSPPGTWRPYGAANNRWGFRKRWATLPASSLAGTLLLQLFHLRQDRQTASCPGNGTLPHHRLPWERPATRIRQTSSLGAMRAASVLVPYTFLRRREHLALG